MWSEYNANAQKFQRYFGRDLGGENNHGDAEEGGCRVDDGLKPGFELPMYRSGVESTSMYFALPGRRGVRLRPRDGELC
jgi:hypothetical protein